MIIGNTGAGKSFFANGLMGQQDPNIGFFGTSDSDDSCTRGVKGINGYFYGQKLSSYNVKPMLINLFDTPGFADSDPCQIEKNKERIAATLSDPIHAFIFLTDHSNSRIDANQQKLFTMLHEWTMGNIWSNFIIGYSRMTFNYNDKMNRIDDGSSFQKQLNNKKEEIKKTLWKIATEQEWKKRVNDQLVPMTMLDFDNIRVNALNVNQNKVCHFTDGHIDRSITDLNRCYQLSRFDESLDYIISDDADLHHDKWVFIEEAKKLQQIITEFSTHPVQTQKLYWEGKFKKELLAYNERYNEAESYSTNLWREMQQKGIKINKNIFQSLIGETERAWLRLRRDSKFCYDIETKYKPFGIDRPEGLECDEVEKSQGCRLQYPDKYDPWCDVQVPNGWKAENVPNIVLMGNTGIGKSYFANGLMGTSDPANGFFRTSGSIDACTSGVHYVSSYFYGRKLTSYNVEPMLINLFDTPGFADNDSCQIEKIKERIAAFFSEPIHAFIFLTDHSNSRLGPNQQKLFRMLNEWTLGHIWNNFIVGFPRMTFDHDDKIDRINKATSFNKQLNIKKEQFKNSLWKTALEQKWKKLDQADRWVPLQRSDFDNIRVNALNVNQNQFCKFTADGKVNQTITDLGTCYQLPRFNESLDYIISDDASNNFQSDEYSDPFAMDSESSSEDTFNYDLHDDKWIFIEEARKLQEIIKDFSRHPVSTQKPYLERKYQQQLDAYFQRRKEASVHINTDDLFRTPEINTGYCKDRRNRKETEIRRSKERRLRNC